MRHLFYFIIAIGFGIPFPAQSSDLLPRVTQESFGTVIQNSYGLKVVEVWAPWCPFCKKAAPEVEKFHQRYQHQVPVYILNFDEHRDFAKELGVSKIPTFLLFHDGKHVRTLRDVPTTDEIVRWINRYARPRYGNNFLTP